MLEWPAEFFRLYIGIFRSYAGIHAKSPRRGWDFSGVRLECQVIPELGWNSHRMCRPALRRKRNNCHFGLLNEQNLVFADANWHQVSVGKFQHSVGKNTIFQHCVGKSTEHHFCHYTRCRVDVSSITSEKTPPWLSLPITCSHFIRVCLNKNQHDHHIACFMDSE